LYSKSSNVNIEAEVAIIDQKQADGELVSKGPIAPVSTILLTTAKWSITSFVYHCGGLQSEHPARVSLEKMKVEILEIRIAERLGNCSPMATSRLMLGGRKHLSSFLSNKHDILKRVRALVGAILESIDCKVRTQKLKDSLNPFTKYELGIQQTDLSTINNWNIR